MLDLFDLENITVLGMYRQLGAVFVRLKRRRAARRKHLSRSRPFSIKKVIDLFHQISPFFANTEILFCCVTLLSTRKNNSKLNIHFDCKQRCNFFLRFSQIAIANFQSVLKKKIAIAIDYFNAQFFANCEFRANCEQFAICDFSLTANLRFYATKARKSLIARKSQIAKSHKSQIAKKSQIAICD